MYKILTLILFVTFVSSASLFAQTQEEIERMLNGGTTKTEEKSRKRKKTKRGTDKGRRS
ncbi:MAG: hypothetical protein LRY27_00390 [Chitinophagales bacterium]|nr:hypothetical protein [Chitinophagales bacterium]